MGVVTTSSIVHVGIIERQSNGGRKLVTQPRKQGKSNSMNGMKSMCHVGECGALTLRLR